MKLKFVNRKSNNRRLVLFFAGWGMDANPFRKLASTGFDIAVVYDYRSAGFPLSCLNGYSEICVFAWSFGVANASRFISSHPELPVTLRVAVNGTLFPVDDRRGIPLKVFNATVGAFSEAGWRAFVKRMCGTHEIESVFWTNKPERGIAGQAEELEVMRGFAGVGIPWDAVYISDRDRIIPTSNQIEAWSDIPSVRMCSSGHMPDINSIMHEMLVDKERVGAHFASSASTYAGAAVVQGEIARRLIGLLPDRKYRRILEVGAGVGTFTNEIRARFPGKRIRMWDLNVQQPGVEQCDAEMAICGCGDCSLDLIASASTIQWFHSPMAFVRQCHRVLAPGGVALLSTFAPSNFKEIRGVADISLQYQDKPEWEYIAHLDNWSNVTFVKEDISVDFDSPIAMLKHLRDTGVNSLTAGGEAVKLAKSLVERLPKTPDGRYPLTYSPLYIVLEK